METTIVTIDAPSPAEVWLRVYTATIPTVVSGHAAAMAAKAVEQFDAWKAEYDRPTRAKG